MNIASAFFQKLPRLACLGSLAVFISIATHSGDSPAQSANRQQAISFNNALVDAADQGNLDEVIHLIKQGNPIDSRGDFGVTPLMRASFRGHNKIVETLISLGADVDTVDFGGASAMHLAARQGQAGAVKLLLNGESSVDLPDSEGWTPLMRASVAKKSEIITSLLQKGANPKKRNKNGETALVYAVKTGDQSTVRAFVDQGATKQLAPYERTAITTIARQKGNKEIEAMLADTATKPVLTAVPVVPMPLNAPTALAPATKKSSRFAMEVREAPRTPVALVQPKSEPMMPQELPQQLPAANTQPLRVASVRAEPVFVEPDPVPVAVAPAKKSFLGMLSSPFENLSLPKATPPAPVAAAAPKRNFSAAAVSEQKAVVAPKAIKEVTLPSAAPVQIIPSKSLSEAQVAVTPIELSKPIEIVKPIDMPKHIDSAPLAVVAEPLPSVLPPADAPRLAPPAYVRSRDYSATVPENRITQSRARRKAMQETEIQPQTDEPRQRRKSVFSKSQAEFAPQPQEEAPRERRKSVFAKPQVEYVPQDPVVQPQAEAPRARKKIFSAPQAAYVAPQKPVMLQPAELPRELPKSDFSKPKTEDALPLPVTIKKPEIVIKPLDLPPVASAPVRSQPEVVDLTPLPAELPVTVAPLAPKAVELPKPVKKELKPQASFGEKKPQVNVAEAIRVPLSTTEKPAAVSPPVQFSPSDSRALKKTVWVQLGEFSSEQEATDYINQLQNSLQSQGLRSRVITSVQGGSGASIRLGPVLDENEAASLCKQLAQGNLVCSQVRDFGKSFTLNQRPGNLVTAVKFENRKDAIFKNEQKYWLQFGTFDSESAAENRMASLKDVYSQKIRSLSFYISAPQNGSNTTAKFRLRAGAFPTYELASLQCDALMESGANCIVVQD